MKNNLHLIWLTTLLMLVCQSLSAHDFEVDGIYYEYYSQEEKTVSVIFKGYNEYSYDNEYSGHVIIPESVKYAGITYRVTSIGLAAFMDALA